MIKPSPPLYVHHRHIEATLGTYEREAFFSSLGASAKNNQMTLILMR